MILDKVESSVLCVVVPADSRSLRILVRGQVTIIFVVSVGLSVCLSVCLFACAKFFSAVFDPISMKTRTYVIRLGLVVSCRI